MKNFSAIVLLFIANSISGLAQGISMIAIPWYFTMSGEMALFGKIYVLTNIISFFWVPYSGIFIDRYNRKHIFLVITTVCGLILCSIAGLGYYWGTLPWYLVAMVFMMTFFNYNIHYPNLFAFVQEITEKKNYGKITSYIEIQGQMASVMAGAGAALLLEGSENGYLNVFGFDIAVPFKIKAWSIYEIFMMDASTYLLAFFIIALIKFQPLKVRKKEGGGVWDQLKIGYQYLIDHSRVFLFGVASYSIFVSVLIMTFYLAAMYVDVHLKESGDVFAASEMYYAIGAVFAGAGIRWLFKSLTLPMSVIIMTLLTSGLFAVLGFTNNTIIFYLMSLVLGVANAGTRIMRTTYLMSHIPNQVYGRAGSIFFLTNIILRIILLSLFSIPFFHIGSNIIYAFFIVSFGLLIASLILIRNYTSFLKLESD